MQILYATDKTTQLVIVLSDSGVYPPRRFEGSNPVLLKNEHLSF